MYRRLSIIVMILVMVLLSRGLCKTITQLQEEISTKLKRFDDKVKDMTIEMETIISQDKREVVTSRSKIFRKGLKVRIENTIRIDTKGVQGQEMTSTMVYDGKDVWMIDPFGGVMKIEDIPFPLGYMDLTRFIPKDAIIIGEDKVDGRLCHLISYAEPKASNATPGPLIEYRVWLDKERLIPLKIESKDSIVLFKNYKKIAGMWGLPYKILIRDKMQDTVSYVKDVRINTGLSDMLFKVDVKAIQRP